MKGRALLASLAFALALLLGSCSSYSDFVANHWPHLAGGEPAGLPPRPGEPGYAHFMASEAGQDPSSEVAGQARPTAAAAKSSMKSSISRKPSPAASPSPATTARKSMMTPAHNVVQGGLY
jgi:hypothetical protein